jgi:hypothetical protein
MYKGAIITETQKNILLGLMFSENSFFSPFERNGLWYISEAEVLQNNNTNVSWVNALELVELPPLNFWHEEDKEGDKLYFYSNTILPEHQAIFDAYPNLEITVNHAEN